ALAPDESRQVHVWDVDNGQLVRSFPVESDGTDGEDADRSISLTFLTSSDGRMWVRSGDRGSHSEKGRLSRPEGRFSAKGNLVVTVTRGEVCLWDLATGKERLRLPARPGLPSGLQARPGDPDLKVFEFNGETIHHDLVTNRTRTRRTATTGTVS